MEQLVFPNVSDIVKRLTVAQEQRPGSPSLIRIYEHGEAVVYSLSNTKQTGIFSVYTYDDRNPTGGWSVYEHGHLSPRQQQIIDALTRVAKMLADENKHQNPNRTDPNEQAALQAAVNLATANYQAVASLLINASLSDQTASHDCDAVLEGKNAWEKQTQILTACKVAISEFQTWLANRSTQ